MGIIRRYYVAIVRASEERRKTGIGAEDEQPEAQAIASAPPTTAKRAPAEITLVEAPEASWAIL